LALYKLTAALVRAYADIANEMPQAGYAAEEASAIAKEVAFYENLRNEVKLHSGDAIDLKRYEPAMRHLIDTYISASIRPMAGCAWRRLCRSPIPPSGRPWWANSGGSGGSSAGSTPKPGSPSGKWSAGKPTTTSGAATGCAW
jgi:hypothetical protein